MDLKEVIVREGAKEFAKKGYSETKISDIAMNCDISVGSFYKIFESKYDLLLYIIEIHLQDALNFITDINSKPISMEKKLKLFMRYSTTSDEDFLNRAVVIAREAWILYEKPSYNILSLYKQILLQFKCLLEPHFQKFNIVDPDVTTIMGIFYALVNFGNTKVYVTGQNISSELCKAYISVIFNS